MKAGAETTIRLPRGVHDEEGGLHRDVSMRPARVRDEIRALQDFRVYLRPATHPEAEGGEEEK